jgi:hypothetical protein
MLTTSRRSARSSTSPAGTESWPSPVAEVSVAQRRGLRLGSGRRPGTWDAAIRAGVEERCDDIGGDLFEGVPPGADIYRMSSILHDWPDERVIEALPIVRDPMSDHARLLVIDFLLPQPGDESAAAQAQVPDDLNMLVKTGGHDRRASELREPANEFRANLSVRFDWLAVWDSNRLLLAVYVDQLLRQTNAKP